MVKSPQDFAAGLFLILVGVLAFLGAGSLPFGGTGGVGSGMLPKSMALLVGALGLMIAVGACVWHGEQLTAWSVREIALVLGAILVFAMTIRGTTLPFLGLAIPPLGLAVAGPLTVLVAAQADRSTKPVEALIFAVVLMALCIVLFRLMLRLPIPVFPPLLGY